MDVKKPKKWIPVVVACILIVVICGIAGVSVIVERYGPSKERVDLYDWYQVSGETEAAVLVNNMLTGEKALVQDGEVYLSYSYITDAWNERFYMDESERQLLYVLPDQIVSVAEGTRLSQCEEIKDLENQDAVVWFEKDAIYYISVNYVKQFTDISISVYEDPGRVYIDPASCSYETAVVSKDTQIRKLGGVKSAIVADVAAGVEVEVLDAMDEWSEVRTPDGFVGYIQNKRLGTVQTKERVSDFTEPIYTSLTRDTDVCLVWHQVFSASDNDKLSSLLSGTEGVNVVSPTWFSLNDNEGNFTSLASLEYVEKAHELGLEVWALIDNFSSDVSTYELLSHMSGRKTLIANLMEAAREYELDGINIDFEGMKTETGTHFIEFIRELSVECRKEGLVLSVDNYVPASGTEYYQWKEQGTVADYVIVMCYDEHWSTSDAGSTASLPFVEKGIEDMLEYVPQKKLIAALPFYTRDWEFDASAEIGEQEDPLSAAYVVNSTAVGMEKALRLLTEAGAELSWDTEAGQYYGEYEENGSLHRIWLEDATSLQRKLDVTASYDLAGVAFWKLGLEADNVWEEISRYLAD
jgi:spore germination protein YaaH